MSKPIITVDDVRTVQSGSKLVIPAQAIVTDLARELAEAHNIILERSEQKALSGEAASSQVLTVAMGSDHGDSFSLKERLKFHLEESGYTVVDCGVLSPESVDYPDIAYAVAKQVANGSAWRGVIIDGAGIGSCMAANKVPGIRAALCYNQAMAHNSREHNNANVLTLGAGMIGFNLAKQIVNIWLTTDFAGGRHERRVNKIMDIERRFSKG